MHKIIRWFKSHWRNIRDTTVIVVCAILLIGGIGYASYYQQHDFTLTIYQSITADNQTFKPQEPIFQIQMDKGSFFTWDGWTLTVK